MGGEFYHDQKSGIRSSCFWEGFLVCYNGGVVGMGHRHDFKRTGSDCQTTPVASCSEPSRITDLEGRWVCQEIAVNIVTKPGCKFD